MEIILEEDRNIHKVIPGFFFFIHYAICYESVISMLSLVNDSKLCSVLNSIIITMNWK